MPLSHARARRWASAALDESIPARRQLALDAHLERCAACAEWYDAVAGFGRQARMRQTPAGADLTPDVVSTHHRIRRAALASTRFSRLSIAAIALAQIYLTVPDLLSGVHAEHHLGVFDLALAVSMLYAAWRPARAIGMLPFLSVLGVGLLASSAMDIANGETPALSEAPHLLVLLEAGLIWQLQRFGVPRLRPPRSPSAVIPEESSEKRVA